MNKLRSKMINCELCGRNHVVQLVSQRKLQSDPVLQTIGRMYDVDVIYQYCDILDEKYFTSEIRQINKTVLTSINKIFDPISSAKYFQDEGKINVYIGDPWFFETKINIKIIDSRSGKREQEKENKT